MYGRLQENHTPLPGLIETTRTSTATQQKRAETPKKKPYYSQTVSWQTGVCYSYSMIPKLPSPPHRGQTPPSAFQYLPAPTDRQRKAQVPSIAEMDIQALYWQIIGSQWLIPRTLDPTHIPFTTTSSSWVSLLKHPTLKIHEIRKAFLIPVYSYGITQTLRDSMYHVQQDALAIGPDAEKRGHKKPMRLLLVSKWATPGRNHHTYPL